jgi:hypothetical protein
MRLNTKLRTVPTVSSESVVAVALKYWYRGSERHDTDADDEWWIVWKGSERKVVIQNASPDKKASKLFTFPKHQLDMMSVRFRLSSNSFCLLTRLVISTATTKIYV